MKFILLLKLVFIRRPYIPLQKAAEELAETSNRGIQ